MEVDEEMVETFGGFVLGLYLFIGILFVSQERRIGVGRHALSDKNAAPLYLTEAVCTWTPSALGGTSVSVS